MNTISFLKIVNYSLGNLSYGVILQIISSFLTFFGTSVLGISGTVMGTVVFVSVMWDAVTDPVMGYISDNTRSKRFGKRHGYLIFGMGLLVLSNALLWSVRPEWAMPWRGIILFTALILCKTFITIFATPYSALGAELSNDYDERTKIQSVKSAFFLIGLAMPTVLGVMIFFRPTPGYPLGQLNPNAYLPLGLFTSFFALVCAIPCIVSTWQKRTYPKAKPKGKFSAISMFKEMASPLRNRESRNVILGYLWQNVTTAIVMTLNLHIFTYTFELTSTSISMVSAVLLVASIISQPFWVKRTFVRDKKRAVLESVCLAAVGSVMFAVLVATRHYIIGNGWVFIPFAAISGFAMGGMVCIPQAMIIDTIDMDEYLTGKRKEGTMYGCMTLFYKISQAITIFGLGVYLDVIGFNASLGRQTSSINAMLGYSLPVALIVTLGVTFYYFHKYSLNKQKVKDIQKGLEAKRN